MRITEAKKQENRARIVETAAAMFREYGFDGVRVADLMTQAGFTHGGFYNHFGSKDDLIMEASAKCFGEAAARYAGRDAIAAIEAYISREHRDARSDGCPAAALAGDVARQADEAKAVFAIGIEGMLNALQHEMVSRHGHRTGARAKAMSVLAQAVGAVVLSRACPDTSLLADELIDVCRADCCAAVKQAQSKKPPSSRRVRKSKGASNN